MLSSCFDTNFTKLRPLTNKVYEVCTVCVLCLVVVLELLCITCFFRLIVYKDNAAFIFLYLLYVQKWKRLDLNY